MYCRCRARAARLVMRRASHDRVDQRLGQAERLELRVLSAISCSPSSCAVVRARLRALLLGRSSSRSSFGRQFVRRLVYTIPA